MNKEKEIEQMTKITGLCDYPDISCEQCRLKHNMHLCAHRESMRKLIDAGYSNTKQVSEDSTDKLEQNNSEMHFAYSNPSGLAIDSKILSISTVKYLSEGVVGNIHINFTRRFNRLQKFMYKTLLGMKITNFPEEK